MKLEFKFTIGNFIGFAFLGGLFYWLCPLPSAPLGRGLVCAGVGILLFAACFVVITHRGPIRPASHSAKKHKK